MKTRHFISRFACAVCAVALCAGLVGCGHSSAATNELSSPDFYSSATDYAESSGSADGSTLLPDQPDADRKIVYNATLRLESTEFDTARDTLLAAVTDCGGYLQNSDVSGSADEASRYASYTVRVPVDRYSDFLAAAGKAGSVLNMSESADDITSSYVDVQARLTALEAQRDRLNALAEAAETTADLLEIESQLSDVQYQLESYTQQLRAMDNQVSYSTVDITLREVATLTPTGTSFAARAGAALRGGWTGFVALIQWLILAVIYLLPLLILGGAIAFVLVRTHPARAARKAARAAKKPAHTPGAALYAPPAGQEANGENKPE